MQLGCDLYEIEWDLISFQDVGTGMEVQLTDDSCLNVAVIRRCADNPHDDIRIGYEDMI